MPLVRAPSSFSQTVAHLYVGSLAKLSLSGQQARGVPVFAAASSSKSGPKRKKHRHPNFRDFPEGENPLNPRSFTSNTNTMYHCDDSESVNTLFTQGPAGEPVEYTREDLLSPDEGDYNPRHPPHVSEIIEDALTETTAVAVLDPYVDSPSAPSNFSQSGIVHLAPIDPSLSRSRSIGSLRGRSPSSAPLDSIDRDMNIVHLPSTNPDTAVSTAASLSGSGSGSGSASADESGKSSSGSSSEGPHITFRYQHMEDENGHPLIVGREGKLTKCEDEVSDAYFIPSAW